MELSCLLVVFAVVLQGCEGSLVEKSIIEGDSHLVEGKRHVERVSPCADAEVLSELAVDKCDLVRVRP